MEVRSHVINLYCQVRLLLLSALKGSEGVHVNLENADVVIQEWEVSVHGSGVLLFDPRFLSSYGWNTGGVRWSPSATCSVVS